MEEFSSSRFEVLAFPCNNFHLQEPGANYSEILNGIKWVRPGGGYVPKFQMFKKIDVNGKNEHPLYTYLKSRCGPTSDEFDTDDGLFYDPIRVSDVRWNFEIFLISRSGVPIYRYSPDVDMEDIAADIRKMISSTSYIRNEQMVKQQPYVRHSNVDAEASMQNLLEELNYMPTEQESRERKEEQTNAIYPEQNNVY